MKIIFQAIFLGILQGLTEFLPVSSSGHLVIAQHFFPELKQQPLLLVIILHLGTLFALCTYFLKDIKAMLFTPRLAFPILVATFVTALVVFPLKGFIEATFNSPRFACIMLLITGTFLFVAGRLKNNTHHKVSWQKAIGIGLAQALAVLPGISRSGTTISAGIYLGLTGETAGRFSFLIAIPAIFGAGVLSLKDMTSISSHLLFPYLTGFLCSFFSSLWAIRWLLRLLTTNQKRLIYFAYYCWSIGIIFLWIL